MAFLEKKVRPGIKTKELDELAKKLIQEKLAKPAFLGYKPDGAQKHYPASLCVSINEEIVHGLPGERILKEGDIVSLDLGLEYKGLFNDMAVTVGVGKIGEEQKKLIETTRKSLELMIDEIRPGIKTGDLGNFIETFVKSQGYRVIKGLVGHGIGRKPQEFPMLPNWGEKNTGDLIAENMIVALEPMISKGNGRISLKSDGWTYQTKDGSLSAHFEHTILVSKNRGMILTRN